MRRLVLCLMLPFLLAGCAVKSVYAPDAEVQQAAYRADGPPALTLFTMINNRSGEGGHAALMVNGSQRVMFDPAGSWFNKAVPERNDVLFGVTPRVVELYTDYHARETYHVVTQTVVVTPEAAELALRLVQENGPVGQGRCSNSISRILAQVPGFTTLGGSIFPARLMRNFGALPGVQTQTFRDSDPDDNKYKLAEQG